MHILRIASGFILLAVTSGLGATPELEACLMNDDAPCLERIITPGFDLEKSLTSGASPLFTAVFHGKWRAVSTLVERGASPNHVYDGIPLLALAVNNAPLNMLQLLLDAGGDVEKAISPSGDTPLIVAVLTKDIEKVDLLLRYKANPNIANAKGNYPISYTKGAQMKAIYDRLVVAGAIDTFPDGKVTVSIQVMDYNYKVPDPYVKVKIYDANGGLLFERKTDAQGRQQVMLDQGSTYVYECYRGDLAFKFPPHTVDKVKGHLSLALTLALRVNHKFAKSIPIKNVNFKGNSALLPVSSYTQLDGLAKKLIANRDMRVEISGHTADVGACDGCLTLSQQRAEAVVRYLIGKGAIPDQLYAKGYAQSKPVATNKNEAGRQKNRRIEFNIVSE